MFSTVKSVEEYTGKDLSVELLNRLDPLKVWDFEYESRALIKRAQAIIEIFIGKDEIDIQSPTDLLLLDKMTAYQTVYMLDNQDAVFNQIAVTSQGQTDYMVNFDTNMMAPWIAPLAVLASKGLTFKRSRSLKTGKIFQWPTYIDWRKI